MSIQLRLTVTETILRGFQRPNGQRRVATPTNEKSYRLEIYKLQIQHRHELSTQSRLTVQTIRVDTRGQPGRRRVNVHVNRSPFQWIHTRTRRLPIAASMRFDKLPSNWVNWRLQGRFHSPYATQSRVTGNAEANPISVHLDDSQLTINGHIPQKKCTENHGGFTRYAPFTSSDATHGSSNRNYLLHDSMESSTWRIMISDMITGIIGRSMGNVQDAGVADRAAVLNGKYNCPDNSYEASNYDSRLPLSIITLSTWSDDRIGSLWGERAICANSVLFCQTSQRKLIANERIRMCPYDGIQRGFLGIQWW
jgi:hypothetical protein